MKRRSFVKASLFTGSLPAIATSVFANGTALEKAAAREYYEIRTYTLQDAAQQKMVEDYYQNAAIPALNKLGSKNIGVFTELKPEGQTKLYVIIPYADIEAFAAVHEKLMNDATYRSAAEAYLNAPATAPAYQRIENSLLYAFSKMPNMKIDSGKPRIFELRRYESPTEAAGKKKIEMFNTGGEIDIFLNKGLPPVFFGECLIGDNRPHLTYMLQFDDMAAHDSGWKSFGTSDEWNKLKSVPDYADAKLISKITSTFLVPTAFSQV